MGIGPGLAVTLQTHILHLLPFGFMVDFGREGLEIFRANRKGRLDFPGKSLGYIVVGQNSIGA